MDMLPYHYVAPSGEPVSFEFRLHPETGSVVRVQQLLDRLVRTLNHEIGVLGDTCNGDVLQALAMALAVRVERIPVAPDQSRELALDVVERALNSRIRTQHPPFGPVGHA